MLGRTEATADGRDGMRGSEGSWGSAGLANVERVWFQGASGMAFALGVRTVVAAEGEGTLAAGAGAGVGLTGTRVSEGPTVK